MRSIQKKADELLDLIGYERRALLQRERLIESAEDSLEELKAEAGARPAAERLERSLAGLRREVLGEAAEHLGRAAELMEDLAAEIGGMEELATLGELSASVAHEIRNPLCGMLLSAEVLQTKMDADDSRNILLNNLHREAEKMEKVVNNLLHFARHYRPRPAACRVEEVVGETVDSIKSHLKSSGVEVHVEAAAAACEAEIDADLVQQVFRNILLNAVDACPAGADVQVRVRRFEERGTVAVEFADEGEGIEADALSRIFDPFYTSKSNGVGLGLSVSKKIVEAHGGRIEVASRPGEGATFTVVFPRRAETGTEKIAA